LQGGFGGPVNFFFGAPASVTPGTTYYFQPYFISGDGGWGIAQWSFQYPGGTAFYNGVASPGSDLWFREGIVAVPEPSSIALTLLGGGCLAVHLRRKSRNR
jgi:hypothetical protein